MSLSSNCLIQQFLNTLSRMIVLYPSGELFSILVAAGGIMSVIPILLFVIFAQNYLIAGLSSGAVKE